MSSSTKPIRWHFGVRRILPNSHCDLIGHRDTADEVAELVIEKTDDFDRREALEACELAEVKGTGIVGSLCITLEPKS